MGVSCSSRSTESPLFMITQNRLQEILNYNPETGIFTWKIRQGFPKERQAGHKRPNGYRAIMVDGKIYYSHRLAWLFVHGELPPFLDHKNQIRSDNTILNLRVATRSDNECNKGKTIANHSGVRGVSMMSQSGKFKAVVYKNKKAFRLGSFSSLEDAAEAVRIAKIFHHGEFANHG